MDNPQRHALACKDFASCCTMIRGLWRYRHFAMPRTRKDIRDDIRWFVQCARRAKQVVRSTAS